MKSPVTVLVVGAGRFGRNYVNILSSLNHLIPEGLPHIGTLVLSRTDLEAARNMADETAGKPACDVDQIIGVQIRNTDELEAALEAHTPYLTCITARDSQCGDDIHARYARPAMDHGAVLCEKPFSNATGDGRSLGRIEQLSRHANAHRFGLELPMAVMGDAIWANERMQSLLRGAVEMEFLWEKQNGSDDLISDLAIHPWSLLPESWEIKVDAVRNKTQRMAIDVRLLPDDAQIPVIPCRIGLSSDGLFRGLRIDDVALQIHFEQGQLQLLEYSAPWPDVVAGRVHKQDGRKITAIHNPLLHHIKAALAGKPLVGLKRTWQSQHFLEESFALTHIAGP